MSSPTVKYVASVPTLSGIKDEPTRKALQAIADILNVRQGNTRNETERFVTFGELGGHIESRVSLMAVGTRNGGSAGYQGTGASGPGDFTMQFTPDWPTGGGGPVGGLFSTNVKDLMSALTNNADAPFFTSGSSTYILDAFIQSLTADKIIAGTIGANLIKLGDSSFQLDGSLKRLKIYPNSGGTGTPVVELGWFGGSSYGIIIRDGSGNIILSSGTSGTSFGSSIDNTGITISGGAIGGIGTGNGTTVANSSITISGGTVSGIGGSPPTLVTSGNPITSGNVSTYISSAAIGNAYINDLNAAKINAGTLTAMNIRGSSTIGIGSGSSPGGFIFEVTSGGVPYCTDLYSSYIHSEASSTYPAVTGNTSGAVEGIVGRTLVGNSSSLAHGIRGQNLGAATTTSGLVGAANGYDFYADGAGTNYGPFTGAHDALVPNGADLELGDIVVDVACKSRRGWSNTIFEVAISSAPNQKAAVGVVASILGPLHEHEPAVFIEARSQLTDGDGHVVVMNICSGDYYDLADTHTLLAMNALGEGQMNVCGEGGDIEAGDLIVTSSLPGKGMKQADDIVRNYTVAKSREAVTFTSPTEVKQVACIYLCG